MEAKSYLLDRHTLRYFRAIARIIKKKFSDGSCVRAMTCEGEFTFNLESIIASFLSVLTFS